MCQRIFTKTPTGKAEASEGHTAEHIATLKDQLNKKCGEICQQESAIRNLNQALNIEKGKVD